MEVQHRGHPPHLLNDPHFLDDFAFPRYDTASLQVDAADTITTTSTTSEATTPLASPDSPLQANDDCSLHHEPAIHVDYLSHNWAEAEISSSWRYIVGRRKSYHNSARLENASWRTWAKAKYGLKTVNPEQLNWLKDCDVTWLYGPFRPSPQPQPPITRASSAVQLNKKPILKKRSMSECMLAKSLSSNNLVKQAVEAVRRSWIFRGAGAWWIWLPRRDRAMSRQSGIFISIR